MNTPNLLSLGRRLGNAAIRFVSVPASARPLAAFRIGLAAVLLMQAFTLAGSLLDLYGSLGVVQWRVGENADAGAVPRIGWLVSALAPLGVSDVACVRGVFLAYVTGLGFLLIGWRTRTAATVAWLTHLAMNVSGNAGIYGVDQFANIALFYCVVMPVGQALSADRMGQPQSDESSADARLSLRVLQLHLCVVYLASGIEKASGAQWWNGEAIWRALMRPDMNHFDITWLPQVPWVAKLATWGTLVVELGYAVFVWPRRTRRIWALATIGMHVGIAVMLGLVSFSGVMIVLTFAAFVVSAEPSTRLAASFCERPRPALAEAGS